MDLFYRISIFLSTILLFTLSVTGNHSVDIKRQPFHLSWTNNHSRFDIIFSIEENLTGVIRLETVDTNKLVAALVSCSGFAACLLRDGEFVQSYKHLDSDQLHKLIFTATGNEHPFSSNSTISSSLHTTDCNKSEITINNYCSTHWNPPAHLFANGCSHSIEWHSPISCTENATNYERPCYIYDAAGGLIDLTPWILVNGSSYEVDTGVYNNTIKQFNLNVCNEAHTACGPNVSSCFVDEKHSVESGFNNLTSIGYDSKDSTVLLTSLGQYKELCPNQRVKTIVRFVCKQKIVANIRPTLIRATACENIVEWQTIHACPISETRVPATQCSIKYKPLGIDINLRQFIRNDTVEVPISDINGKKKSMMLGLCQGIKTTQLKCEGKSTSTTTACLLDVGNTSTIRDAKNSQIVGSIMKSYIRLADSRLYLESFAINKSCEIPMGRNFNATRQVGTRIEFFCSSSDYSKPVYLGYDDCTYIFEWGTQLMCLESFVPSLSSHIMPKNTTPLNNNSSGIQPHRLSDKELKINLEDESKSAHEMHQETLKESKTIIESHIEDHIHDKKVDDASKKQVENEQGTRVVTNNTDKPSQIAPNSKTPESVMKPVQPISTNNRMNKLHKFFMIGLIVMSLAGFVIIIFILDKKTQLRLPLSSIRRQARQAFQPQPVPYTRVDQFNDLDL